VQELDAAQMPVHQGSEAAANFRMQEHTRLWGVCLVQTLAFCFREHFDAHSIVVT
jgi:hypothetical protein